VIATSLALRWLALRVSTRLQHRGDLLLVAASNLVIASVGLVFLGTMFHHADGLGPWTARQVWFAWGFAETVAGLFYVVFGGLWVLNQRYLLGGELDRVLVRPVDPLAQVLIDNVALEDLAEVGLGVAVMIAAWPAGLGWRAVLVPVYLLSALAVLGGLALTASAAGAWLKHRGTAVGLLLQGASLSRYPLDVLGTPVRWALTVVLPLGFAGWMPAREFLAEAGAGRWTPVVGMACMAVGIVAWRKSLRAYTSSGS
jgi:ABC-2 type transport system permease protein